ncbi:MAG: pyroglutamyl-peptidase I [Kosmotogaceae bacterium]
MKKILISYFEPFGKEMKNSSELTVNAYFKQYREAKNRVVSVKLPTTFKDSASMITEKISNETPDAIIMLGQAAGRETISIERVAINIIDARIPDNNGEQPIDKPVIPGGKNAYFSKLHTREIKEALEKKNIPITISYSAGTYVCNYLFYSVMYFIEHKKLETLAGFVHLPLSSSQIEENSDKPSLNQLMLVDGINEIIKVCDKR